MNINSKLFDILMVLVSVALIITFTTLPILYKVQAIEELKDKAISELIQKGVDPIAARCSIADQKDQICIIYVATKQPTISVK